LEAEFSVLSNDAFHKISDEVIREVGLPLSERVFPAWQKWLNAEIKKKRHFNHFYLSSLMLRIQTLLRKFAYGSVGSILK